MSSWRERLQETRESIERRVGFTVTQTERLSFLEESDTERRVLQRELDLLAYTALNYVGGSPQELKANERRRLAQRSRVVWMKDPQAGAAVDLMNDFVFGRGLTKPKANDPQVQEIIDEAWEDPDNQLVLTDFFAQLALGTDFELQSNLFFLVFEDGQDGKVKLGLLNHDSVETVVRDEDNRLRILYYVARHWSVKWDFQNDQPMLITAVQERERAQANGLAPAPVKQSSPNVVYPGQGDIRYYEHWRNVEDAEADAESGSRQPPDKAPPEKLGDGKVYHVAMNRGSEMAFGHPRMDRLIRWYNAYNNFMDARVDIMAASAAFVMKRKVKGTPAQLQKMANQALSRRSALAMGRDPIAGAEVGPKAAGILTENDSVCFDAATEMLTADGWLSLDDLKVREALPDIAVMRDGVLAFERPASDLLLYERSEMVRITGPRVDALVTPNHRMLVVTPTGLETKRADELRRGDRVPLAAGAVVKARVEAFVLPRMVHRPAVAGFVPTTRGYESRSDDERAATPAVTLEMDRWLRWLGWFVAEGHAGAQGHVAITQALKSPALESAQEACRELGLPGVEEQGVSGVAGTPMWKWRARAPKRLRLWLREHVGTLAANKRVPGFVFGLAAEQQAIMLRSLMEGDGTYRAESWDAATRGEFFTASEGLADDVQRMALECGYEAAKLQNGTYRDRAGERHPMWRVSIYKGGDTKGRARRGVGVGIVRHVATVPYDGEVYCFTMPSDTLVTRRAGRVLVSRNSHEDFNITTNAPQAMQDAQMIRSQISAATRWPQSYYGDASQSNLATATSLELPVLKSVETRQTIFEHIVRFFTDRVIERAVDAGRLSRELDDEGTQKAKPSRAPAPTNLEPGEMGEGYEDEGRDEEQTERDLGYEFQMPSPLQRLLGDLVLAVMNVAKTFDPNNTNTELSRTLLTVCLTELGLEDPAGAVERILPAGYVDPAVAAAEGPGGPGTPAPGEGPVPGMPGSSAGEFSADSMTGPMAGDAQNGYGGGYGGGNPYGAKAASQSPEDVAEGRLLARGREAFAARQRVLREQRVSDEPPDFQARVAARVAAIDAMFDEMLDGALGGASANGNGADG